MVMVMILCVSSFLLTPLREGRPKRVALMFNINEISTHAPAGGATLRDKLQDAKFEISTHAPAGGATFASFAASSCAVNFYSRPCGRGDAA